MKVRNGFVSNSSSSSFILMNGEKISDEQIIDMVSKYTPDTITKDDYNVDYNIPTICKQNLMSILKKRLGFRVDITIEQFKIVIDELVDYYTDLQLTYIKYNIQSSFKFLNKKDLKIIIKHILKYCRRVEKLDCKIKKFDDWFDCGSFARRDKSKELDPRLKKIYSLLTSYKTKAVNDIFKLINKNYNLNNMSCFELASDCGENELILMRLFIKSLDNEKIKYIDERELCMLSRVGGVDRYTQDWIDKEGE